MGSLCIEQHRSPHLTIKMMTNNTNNANNRIDGTKK